MFRVASNLRSERSSTAAVWTVSGSLRCTYRLRKALTRSTVEAAIANMSLRRARRVSPQEVGSPLESHSGRILDGAVTLMSPQVRERAESVAETTCGRCSML